MPSRLLKYLRQQIFSSLVIQSWHAAMDGCAGETSALGNKHVSD